jgi:type IX secretion system PorP/SprF family membrane protein
MKKHIITFACLIVLGASFTHAQQTWHYTQYMFNPFIVNPAITGTHNYYQIRSNSRFQWAGMTDAPMTNSLSIFGPHASKDMGWGGYLYNDVTGPTSTTGIMGAYGYNIAITDEIRAAGGINLGVKQYKIDGSKITTWDLDDPVLSSGSVYSTFVPDATFGLYVYSSNFHVGFSANQLINNKINMFDEATGLSKLKSHFFLMGGYKHFFNRDWAIEPSLLLKMVSPVPPQIDLGTKVYYQNIAWFGLSFRSMDAISVLMGYTHERKIFVGYSYDIGITGIRKHHYGSHEVMIGFNFNNIKRL